MASHPNNDDVANVESNGEHSLLLLPPPATATTTTTTTTTTAMTIMTLTTHPAQCFPEIPIHTHTHTHTNEYTVASHRPEKGTSCKARHLDAPDTLESAMLSTPHQSGQVNKIAAASTSVSNARNNSVDSVLPQAFLPWVVVMV